MHNIEIPCKNKPPSLFHVNACSPSRNFDDLQHLPSCTKKCFGTIAVRERRITENVSLLNNLNVNNYSSEFTPTETCAGGTRLYIANHLSYKCHNLLKTDDLNADNSTKIYLGKINMLLDIYVPLKRINKYKLKFKSKPWITVGLQKSISVNNKLVTNLINKKDPELKEEFCTKCKKKDRNLLSTLMKKSKHAKLG